MSYDYRRLFDLTGRTALVVGAGSGIGEAAAEGLAAVGAQVICADLDGTRAANTAARITHAGGAATALTLDLRQPDAVGTALTQPSGVDVLVCTPSINVRKPLLQISAEEFDRIVALNLRGTFLLLKEVGAHMAARGRGSIIVFSSIRSQTIEPGQGVYAATKSGVIQLVRTLAAELGPQGVRANLIAPGIVETPLTAQIQNHPEWYRAYAEKSMLGRWAQPQEMVGAVIYLASDAASFVTGSVFFVDGGWTAVDGRYQPPL